MKSMKSKKEISKKKRTILMSATFLSQKMTLGMRRLKII